MLPTTVANEDSMWQADFFRVSTGLRGVVILWVFFVHVNTTYFNSDVINREYGETASWFNTAAFIILAGFTTYVQTRNKPLHYGRWITGRWFGLIPMFLLMLLTAYVPNIYQNESSRKVAVSTGTQIYLIVMNVLGLSFIGEKGNFGFLHNVTAFDTSAGFGDIGMPLGSALGANYFTPMFFFQMLIFALFHFTLSFRLPRQIFQGCYGLVAGICALGMFAASRAISYYMAPYGNRFEGVNWRGAEDNLLPCFMFGVCVAEIRFHLSHRVKAVLGHWLVVDLTILGFFVFSFMPHFKHLRIFSTGGYGICAAQWLLFAIMLLSLSCQVYHKKRSLIVFGVFQRSFMADIFGKHSYVLYVVQIVIIFDQRYMKWLTCFEAAPGTCQPIDLSSPFVPGASITDNWMYKLYVLLVTVVIAYLVQWWQDTFVSTCHVAVVDFLRPGIAVQCWKVFTDEQNPLSALVLMCWPAEQTTTEEDLEIGQKSTSTAIRG